MRIERLSSSPDPQKESACSSVLSLPMPEVVAALQRILSSQLTCHASLSPAFAVVVTINPLLNRTEHGALTSPCDLPSAWVPRRRTSPSADLVPHPAVGSFLRPKEIHVARDANVKGTLSDAELRKVRPPEQQGECPEKPGGADPVAAPPGRRCRDQGGRPGAGGRWSQGSQ